MSTQRKKAPGSFANEFVCKLKFRNEIPKPTVEPKLLKIPIDLSKYSSFRLFSNEQELVVKNESNPKIDIFSACPSNLIYHSIEEVAQVRRNNEPLDPIDEQLCITGTKSVHPTTLTKFPQSMNGSGKINELGLPENIPGTEGFEIESETDLVNAIAETFEPCDEYLHPNNPSLTVAAVFDLVPGEGEVNLTQCNFDSGVQPNDAGDLMLKGGVRDTERYFDCFSRIRATGDEYKFLREYNYHGYSEDGNTLVLSLVPEKNVAYYSFVNAKINLRKKRGTLIDSRDKTGDTLVIERK